jgi:hypothetical protein
VGSSATATIFFGIKIGDENSKRQNFEKVFTNKKGLDGEKYQVRERAMDRAGLEIVTDGDLSNGVNRHYLAIKSSIQSAEWYEATPLNVDRLKAEPVWEEKIRDFCEKANVDFVAPAFLMIASYG